MLILNDKQVQELEMFIQELPGKYCIPTLNLFRKFAQENQEANTKPESKPSTKIDASSSAAVSSSNPETTFKPYAVEAE